MIHLDELLSAYLDGETTPQESRRVNHHVTECIRCRRRLDSLHDARSLLRSLPTLEVPPGLIPVESEPTTAKRVRRTWWGAAAAVVAGIIALATFLTPEPEPLDLSDLSRQMGARAALDIGAGGLKVMVPVGGLE